MAVNPRGGRRYVYSGPPLASDQGVTGQEVDTPPPPPPIYDNADGYDRIEVMPHAAPENIEVYPYDDVPRNIIRGAPIHVPGPMEDADDPVKQAQAIWEQNAHDRGNEVRYTSEGVFEVDPESNRIISVMPTGVMI